MEKPKCAKCGNTGEEGRLYVTIDARWDRELNAWILERREDDGGDELDCLNCDHRTPAPPFPYESAVLHP